jgi:hypothetical protein
MRRLKRFSKGTFPRCANASAAGADTHFNVRGGHTAEQIVPGAEESKADLIVTGHGGRGVFIAGCPARLRVCVLPGDGRALNWEYYTY